MTYKTVQNLFFLWNPTPTHQSGKLSPTDPAGAHVNLGRNAAFPRYFLSPQESSQAQLRQLSHKLPQSFWWVTFCACKNHLCGSPTLAEDTVYKTRL